MIYNNLKFYKAGDKVSYNGKIYTAKKAVSGIVPFGSTSWQEEGILLGNLPRQVGPALAAPEHSGNVFYKTDDIVKHQGKLYRARAATQGSIPGSSPAWEALLDKLPKAKIVTTEDKITRSADANVVIVVGDKGETGDKGDTGPRGLKGDRGSDSLVAGPMGPMGLQGLKGAKGDKGDTGEKGDKGDRGLQGPAGKDGSGGSLVTLGSATRFTLESKGTGLSLIKAAKPRTAELKSLKAGSNITITDDHLGTLTIASTGGGGGGDVTLAGNNIFTGQNTFENPVISLGLDGPNIGPGQTLPGGAYDYTGMSYVINDNSGNGFVGIWSQGNNYFNIGSFDSSGMEISRFAMGDPGDQTFSMTSLSGSSIIVGGSGSGNGSGPYLRAASDPGAQGVELGDNVGGLLNVRNGGTDFNGPSPVTINQDSSATGAAFIVYDSGANSALTVRSDNSHVTTLNNTLDDGVGNASFIGSISSAGFTGPTWKPSADSTTALSITNAAQSYAMLGMDTTNGRMVVGAVGSTAVSSFDIVGKNSVLSTGTYICAGIFPFINQTGSAGFECLRIAPFINASGSGAKYLIDAGLSAGAHGTSTFTQLHSVDTGGNQINKGSLTLGTTSTSGGNIIFTGTSPAITFTSGQAGFINLNDGIIASQSSAITISTNSNKPINLSPNGTGAINLGASTNPVNIAGVTTISSNLTLNNTAGTSNLTITSSSTNSTGFIVANTSSGGHTWDLFSSGTTNLASPAVPAGAFGFYDSTASSTRLWIDASGNINIGNPATTYITQTGNMVIGNPNGIAVPNNLNVFSTGTTGIQTASFISTGSYGAGIGGAGMIGGADAGSAAISGTRLGFLAFTGATDSAHTLYNSAIIQCLTTELYSSTAGGSQLQFMVTANGTHTRSNALTLDQDQSATFTGKVVGSSSTLSQPLVGCAFTATASNGPSNTATETSLIGTGVGTKTLPSNFLIAGKTIRITGAGVFTTPITTGNLVIKVKYGTTVIATATASNLATSATNDGFEYRVDLTCRTTGASGTVMTNGVMTYDLTAITKAGVSLNNAGATTTIDTTSANALDVTATWSTSTTSTITGTTATIEILN